MTTEFVGVPSSWTVAETLQYVRQVESTRETVYAIYVLDPKTKALVRAISLRRLITGEPQQQVLSICPPRRPLTVSPLADREDVARLISKYDLLAVPVVDKKGHVLGIVTVDDIIDAMIEETHRGRAEIRRRGGLGGSLYGDRLPGNDPEARRLAVRALSWRDADRKRNAAFRVRAGKGRGPNPFHPTHYELGRQLRVPGDLADHPRRGAPGGEAERLVAGGAARIAHRRDARQHSRRYRHYPHCALAKARDVSTMASTGFSSPAPLARRWWASSLSARWPDRCCRSS